MLKRLLTLMFVSLFVCSAVFAQSSAVKMQHKQVISHEDNGAGGPEGALPTSLKVSNAAVGDTISYTTYDYFSNSVIRDQIVFADGKAHLAPMVRPTPGTANGRAIHYIYNDGTSYVQVPLFGAGAAGGWPQIDVSLTGSNAGTLAIVGHTPSRLGIWDETSSSFLLSQFDGSTDPSMQFLGEDIYLATSGNRVQFMFYKTTDIGVTFSNYDSISTSHPSPIWWGANGGVEVGMSKSPDETKLMFFGTNTYNADASSPGQVYNGYARDSADNVWVIYTLDGGTNWTKKSIGWDGDFDIVTGYHVPNYAPLFENFGQIDAAVGNDGVMHFIANGYGLHFNATKDTAIGDAYPILYWNSTMTTWKAISNPAVDDVEDSIMADKRPGNGIGQSYPSISVSADGKVLYAIWSGPEMNGNTVVLDDTSGLFFNDLYHAYSLNGGETWTYGGVLAGKGKVSEAFGHSAQLLQDAGDKYVAHIIYLEDKMAGTSLFAANGTATTNPLVYKTFDLPKPSSVGDGVNLNSFELGQNYPNPFNPTTTINFTLAEKSNVSLKVFDVLGREVMTLVNSTKDAGAHQVSFDAKDLASGLYIYTLKAGNFTSSKKMMLMK